MKFDDEKFNENNYIPDNVSRNELDKLFKDLVDEEKYDSKHFWKHFGNRRAFMPLPVPSLLELAKRSIYYDPENNFDLRLMISLAHARDKSLFIDVASNVAERFVNNPDRPAGPLTLAQFKIILARRLAQVGF